MTRELLILPALQSIIMVLGQQIDPRTMMPPAHVPLPVPGAVPGAPPVIRLAHRGSARRAYPSCRPGRPETIGDDVGIIAPPPELRSIV